MLGECTAISLTTDQESSNELVAASDSPSVIGKSLTVSGAAFAGKAGSAYEPLDYHLKIEPGLSGTITDFEIELLSGASAADGKTATSEYARWGTVTSQADTNPQILVKKVDVRRRKVYSKEG